VIKARAYAHVSRLEKMRILDRRNERGICLVEIPHLCLPALLEQVPLSWRILALAQASQGEGRLLPFRWLSLSSK
jgi:hypothetical protein